MAQLFTSLTEEFDGVSGTLIDYVDQAGVPLPTRRHYDIRSFIGDDITVPRTMLDMRYNNVGTVDTTQMIVLDTPRIVSGRTIAARPIGQFNGIDVHTLNTYSMIDIDAYTLSTGGENWPIDVAVTVGKDSAERWANSLRVALVGGVSKSVTSIYTDNIWTGMESPASTYYIELALPAFPAQAAGTHLDLTNSWIDFTSDPGGTFGPATNSFRFSDSLNNLTAGGDTYWQINRNSLTNVDLKNITAVRFRLLSVGSFTVKLQALRVYKADEYTFDSVDIETKRSQFRRSVPRASGAEPANPNIPTYLMNKTRPKNFTMVGKFNSGHIDSASASTFSIYGRNIDNDNYIKARVSVSNTGTTIEVSQDVNGATTTLGLVTVGTLTPESYYMLVFEAYDSQIRASVYNSYGAFYGALVGTTGYQVTTISRRGRVGFELRPYNYDFFVDYVTAGDAEFGRFESKTYNSPTPVVGATLAATSTEVIDLTEGHFIPAGDATIIPDPQTGFPAPSVKFTRDGTSWQGGYITDKFLFLGNQKYLKVIGDIYPVLTPGQSGVRGDFRIVFIDKWDSVGLIVYIRNLLASQWNHFEIPLNADQLVPGNYRILVQQTGYYADTFFIDNLAVNHLPISWEASPDNGATWYKFLTAINSSYSSVNFKLNPGNQLKIRGSALTDDVWVSEYEVIPFYATPGQVSAPVAGARLNWQALDARISGGGSRVSTSYDARITGKSAPFARTQDARIFGIIKTNKVQDVRIKGVATINKTWTVRVDGKVISSLANDARVTGV